MAKPLIVERVEKMRDLFNIGKEKFLTGMSLINNGQLFEAGRLFQLAVEDFKTVSTEIESILESQKRITK